MRIRWRMALFGASVTLVALVGFGTLLTLLAQATAAADQDTALMQLATDTVAAVQEAPADQLAPVVPPVTIDASESTEQFVQILAEDGSVLYSSATVDGVAPPIPAAVVVETLREGVSSATIIVAEDVEIRVQTMAWSRADLGREGIVVAGQAIEFRNEQLAGLSAVLWVSGFITVIAALVVSWLVSGRALRPVTALAETAEQIRETGDLSRRLPPVTAKDEVGRLTSSFNGMMDRLEGTRGQLENSLASQRRFVADASHELRSPLTTIRNNAGFLVDRPDAALADRREAEADIVAESVRMSGLVDDLLLLARGDAGQKIEHRPVDLAVVAQAQARRFEKLGMSVSTTVETATVMGDERMLEQLVGILLDNASKHGGGHASVQVAGSGGMGWLRVSDRGPGIPTDHVELVFDRFHRVDPARSPAGTGLGLAIARQITTWHGGDIGVSSSADGAVFDVRIPLA